MLIGFIIGFINLFICMITHKNNKLADLFADIFVL